MSSQKELIENLNEIKNQKEALLTPENIRAGVTLFGIEGSSEVVDTSDATAEGYDILKGKVAYTKGYRVTGMYEPLDTSDATAKPENITNGKTAYVNGQKITGSIPTNGNLYYTPSAESQTIPAGYTEGGTVWGDSNLTASNIKKGVTIFNTEGEYTGDLDTSDATATASAILQGKTAYVDGVKITGTMPNNGQKAITPSKSVQQYPNGYYSGVYVAGDNNLIPANIKAGTSIFGVTGELDVSLDTSDGNATSDDIMKDKVAYAKGERIVGQHECLDTSDANAFPSELLAGQTAYVKGEKITGTMKNIGTYEAIIDKDNDRVESVYSYIQKIKTPSISNSIKNYTTPTVYDSHCQGGIQGLTTLTGEVESLKGCRVLAFIMARSAITVSEGWELVAESIINTSSAYQALYIYTKIATADITTFTVTQATAGRMGLNLLAMDLENEVEVIDNVIETTESKSSYMLSNVLKGDLLTHQYYVASDGNGGKVTSHINGPSNTAYRTEDATDRICTYRIDENYSNSFTVHLGAAGTQYSYILLRFKDVETLLPENIRKGVKVMDLIGTFEGEFDHSDATVTTDKLVEGVKAYNSEGLLIEGTMKNNEYLEYTPSDTTQEIPEGYTTGGIVNAADITTLKEYNDCLTLAKSIGSTEIYEGTTATAEDIRKGKTAYSNGELLEGTLVSSEYNAMLTDTLIPGYGNYNYICRMIQRLPKEVKFSGTSAVSLLRDCQSLLELPEIDTTGVTDMSYMCSNCKLVPKILPYNVSSTLNATNIFSNCESAEEAPSFDFQNATRADYAFARCYKLKTIGEINLPKATNLECLFFECKALTELPKITTGAVTNAYGLFYKCSGLQGDIVLDCDLSKATDVKYLFNGCENIKTISLPSMPKANSFSVMLYGCTKLERILSIDPSNITSADGMLTGCTSLTDEGLNDVLQMCINAVKITSTNQKKLSTLGLTEDQATRCQSLSNYQAFLDAGWITGY